MYQRKEGSGTAPPEWRGNLMRLKGKGVQNRNIITALFLDSSEILVRTQMVALDGRLLDAWSISFWQYRGAKLAIPKCLFGMWIIPS